MGSIKKNFFYNSIYQILLIIIPLITTPYISRILGAEGIGEYSYNYSIANYFVLFIMLGLNNYGNREIARVSDNKEKRSRLFWSIYIFQFIWGVFVSACYVVYIVFFDNTPLTLVMLGFVFSALFDVNWCFFGMEQFKITTIRNITIKIITTIAVFIFVRDEDDVFIYSLILVLGMLFSQIILWPYIIKNFNFYKPTKREVFCHIKPNCFLFLTVIAVSIFKVMDKIMLGAMTDKSQVGYYEVSEKIIAIPIALITSLGTVMLPRMTNMLENNVSGKNKLMDKSIICALFLSTSLSFGIMGVSKVFVPLFYGEGYEVCIYLYLILLPSCIFLAFANVIRTQYMLPKKMDKAYVISAFLGAGVNVLVNVMLIPNYGAVGAAIGTFMAEMVVCFYQSWCVRKELKIKRYMLYAIPFVVAGIGMFLILYYMDTIIYSSLITLMVRVFIGVVIYAILLGIGLLISKVILNIDIIHVLYNGRKKENVV